MRVLSLRYFNPIGADPRLRTGLQLPAPSHAVGKLLEAHQAGTPFHVTGVDYATRDGSAIRDYIHVWDLALAHVAALREMDRIVEPGTALPINVGTGNGTTVRELVAAFQAIVGDFRAVEAPRRPGDVIGSYTRSDRAADLLGWKAERSLEDGLRDSLAWLAHRPDVLGF
jgi:UDP-glucose 4-epimerase